VRFRFIAAEKAEHSITMLCRCLRVTRSGFYAWQHRPESAHARHDRRLRVLVRASFEESERRYGSPRILEDLREQQIPVSRKRVIRLMREEGLKARVRKRFKVTTMSDPDLPVATNLLDRQFTAATVNQRWVGDTSEFLIGESGKLYLAAILDLFSRFVVGWAVSAVNDRHLTIMALEMALKRRCPAIGLLHHSDQGCTYASEDYQAILEAHGIICSMSGRGDCYDNAVMEAFFSTVKAELRERFDSRDHAKRELFEYIEVFYNQRRRHSTIGYRSPAAYERAAVTPMSRPASELSQDLITAQAAAYVANGGIVQGCPGRRSSFLGHPVRSPRQRSGFGSAIGATPHTGTARVRQHSDRRSTSEPPLVDRLPQFGDFRGGRVRSEGVDADADAPVDAKNASTSGLEISHRTRDSHSAHAPYRYSEGEEQRTERP
jgi:putative transposase